jgi:hypothetical protein
MNKNAADKILARINAINTILNAGTRTSLTPEGNDAGDICELNHAQIQAVMFNLDRFLSLIPLKEKTPNGFFFLFLMISE